MNVKERWENSQERKRLKWCVTGKDACTFPVLEHEGSAAAVENELVTTNRVSMPVFVWIELWLSMASSLFREKNMPG